MEQLRIDTGIQEYCINGGGILRFNPTDPGLYARFTEFCDCLPGLAEKYDVLSPEKGAKGEAQNADKMIQATRQLDREIKGKLGEVFGTHNDFDILLEGVNLMAPTDTGKTVLENLLDAMLPVVEGSAKARQKRLEGKVKAEKRRAEKARQQRAGAK